MLELPTDRPRPTQQDFKAAFVDVDLDEPLTAALRALGDRHGTNSFATVLAGWAALLARLSGQRDLVIGARQAYRLSAELEPLIGLFANDSPLRIDLSGEPAVGEFLDRVASSVREAHKHQDVRFEQVVEALQLPRSLAHEPLFQVLFVWRDRESVEFDLSGLSVAPIATPSRKTKCELTLRLGEVRGRIVGELEYATALFERPTVERYVGYFRRLLEGMAAADSQAVDRLPLLGDAERHRLLVEWNATEAAYPQDKCVHELFEAQAARTPNAIAVVHEGKRLTYAELNSRANGLARQLRAIGVRPDDRVAICVERGPEMVVGMLGALKAGGAYLPLDPALPVERLAYILKDAAPVSVLTHGPARTALEAALKGLAHQPRVVDVEDAGLRQTDANLGGDEIGLTSRGLAYVFYTSGSTGQPKGVMVEHAACTNRVAAQEIITPLAENAIFAQKTALGFIDSFFETLVPLAHGNVLAIIPPGLARDARRLGAALSELHVSNLVTIPSLAAMIDLKRDDLSALRHWVMSGEALNRHIAQHIRLHLPNCRLWNVYGSTEVTADATYYEVRGTEVGSIPIGRPLPNLRIYILDRFLAPVPSGVVGEIYVGGKGVARGYLNRADLTAERFVESPFVAGDRLFRTGDLGRYLADGNIEYVDRTDFQVKIRGFRIELGEIEARLMQHPAVHEAVVLAREDTPGDKRLVAYYTVQPDAEKPDVAALRWHVAASLPDYMVPTACVHLEALPLNPNGKLDRKALPPPDIDAFAAKPHEPPRGKIEEVLERIFAAALKIERVGRYDDFFELGGDSLLGIGVVFEIEKSLGRKLATASLFSNPTIQGLAADIDREGETPKLISLVPLEPRGSGAPIFMVHMIERDLTRHLGRRHPVYGLSYGLAAVSRKDEIRLPRDIETTASHYIDEMRSVQPRGPYRLIGHSLGGQIAYEMALQLTRAGETVEFLGLIDTDPPGRVEKPRHLPLGQVYRNLLRTSPSRLLRLGHDRLNKSRFVRRIKIWAFADAIEFPFPPA